MERILLFFFTSMLLCLNTFAQDEPLKSALLGIKAGVNLATISSKTIYKTNFKTDFYAGLAVEAMLTEKFGFQIETYYSRQGSKFNNIPTNEEEIIKLDYIQTPILAKVYLLKGFNIQGGLQLGFKVNDKIDTVSFENTEEPNLGKIGNFDFQLVSGIEYMFKKNFFVQVRYSYGVSEVIEDSEIHNSVLALGLGFMVY